MKFYDNFFMTIIIIIIIKYMCLSTSKQPKP